MDIEEAKKFARNKIESDAITKQVRDIIKITKWQKQDMREGFKETFQPLIESQDIIKKSIDEQQNKTIAQLQANQLALTDGLNKNRLAITQGLENLIFEDLQGEEGNISYFNKYLLNKESIDTLKNYGYFDLPSDYYNTDEITINKRLYNVDLDLQDIKNELKPYAKFTIYEDYTLVIPKKNMKQNEEILKKIDDFNVLATYYKNLTNVKNDIIKRNYKL